LAGCSADHYVRSADRQVRQIIDSRTRSTLEYNPTQETPLPQDAAPTRKSYARLPTTVLPSDIVSVIDLAPARETIRPLGPPLDEVPAPASKSDDAGVGLARRIATDQYRLGPALPEESLQAFGLFEAIAYAVQNSRNYQTESERLYTAALDVSLERHLFTPRPFASVSTRYEGGQESVDYRSAMSVASEAGVRQRLPYGGEVVASGLVEFVNALNDNTADGEDARLALNASVPLLRGAGMINLEALIQSERSMIYTIRQFEEFRRDFAVDIASTYFGLLNDQQSIRNRYVRYITSVDLVARSEALFAAGRITALEVQRSQQELFTSEDSVNRAIEAYQNRLDRFKVTIGMPVDEPLTIVPVVLDTASPDLNAEAINDVALRYRLDLQTVRDQLDDSRRRADNARNRLGADLTLSAGSSVGNRDNTSATQIEDGELQYNAGLELDLPVDRLSERNTYRASLISLAQAQRRVRDTEANIAVDVRSAIRAIRSAEVSLVIQNQAIEIARQRLDFAIESLLTGRSNDTRNVVEAQTSLLQAQDGLENARASLQIAILRYYRDTGLLRLDPATGTLSRAMNRGVPDASEP
jgi:hypothetical protein